MLQEEQGNGRLAHERFEQLRLDIPRQVRRAGQLRLRSRRTEREPEESAIEWCPSRQRAAKDTVENVCVARVFLQDA